MKIRTYVHSDGYTTIKCGLFRSLVLRYFRSKFRYIGSYV